MTAKDLLYKYLDYSVHWSQNIFQNAEPALVRKQQLEGLLNAFGLSKKYVNPLVQIKYSIGGEKEKLSRARRLNQLSNIEYFEQGEFLNDRPIEANRELSELATATIRQLYKKPPEDRMKRPVDIGWMFNNLLHFRRDVYRIAYPNEGMLEGFSVGLLYSHYLQAELKSVISANLDEIDNTLWLILDPERKDIETKVLKSEFRYEEVDLDKIDRHWNMDNY